MEMALSFNEIQFDIIDRENQPWIRLPQIEVALGFAKRGAIQTLYTRHADEFTDAMTAVVKLPSDGGEQETRIFSLRGCHLLAMFARTPVAKAFRKWVLDVLDRLALDEKTTSHPDSPASPITPDQKCSLRAIVKARVESLANGRVSRLGLYGQVWSRFNNHFRIAKYCQLPQSRMSEAIEYLTLMEIRLKSLAPSKPLELPASQPSIEDIIEQELPKVTRLHGEISAVIIDLRNRVTHSLYHSKGAGELADLERSFLNCLNGALGEINVTLWSNLNAFERILSAHAHAQKIIRG